MRVALLVLISAAAIPAEAQTTNCTRFGNQVTCNTGNPYGFIANPPAQNQTFGPGNVVDMRMRAQQIEIQRQQIELQRQQMEQIRLQNETLRFQRDELERQQRALQDQKPQ